MADQPINATVLSTTEGDPVAYRPPYLVSIPGGTYRIHHAVSVMIGTAMDDTAVTIALLLPACECGCGKPAMGMEFLPTTDDARQFASQLLEAADQVDTLAKQSADQLLARIAKGGRS
ncbi:hypothetical protein RN629_01155 [Sphingomonadaceae bacterium jetA1]|jgi:hypothetical protein|uniref:hypothetical protein n=1 Tax=Facivitalis istanbulensis TaxID=3075838 RepID=UPI003499EF13